MPADFSQPQLSTAYASFLSILKERDIDALTLCLSDPTSIPTGAMKWDRSNLKLQEYNGSAWVDRVLSISGGGTGAATAAAARTALGLGTMAVQNNNAVAITGGTIASPATVEADCITSGIINVARLGSGAGGSGLKVLYDDNTWKDAEAPGTGKLWFTNTPPSGYLICDGSAISRATYASLFAILGTLHGVGDGSTTFNLPDLRQRFPLGKAASGTGSTIATSGGNIDHTHTGPSHTHTYTDVVAHTHTITDPGHRHGYYDGPGGGSAHAYFDPTFLIGFSDAGYNTSGTVLESKTTGISINSSGVASGTTAASGTGATGTANPPFLVVNYIVKY